MVRLAPEISKLSVFSAPAAVLDSLSVAAPVLLISYFYGEAATGNYAQVQRVIAAPLLLLAMAIGQVFFNRSATFRRSGQSSRRLMWKIVLVLFGAGVVVMGVVGLVGQPVMALLLGSRWRVDTGFLLAVLCPVVIRMCVSPVTSIFLVENKIKTLAIWQVSYFIAAFGVLPFFAAKLSLDQFLVVLIINEFFCMDITLRYVIGSLAVIKLRFVNFR
jgi:O-antigen/teichoic acid export membrane protein